VQNNLSLESQQNINQYRSFAIGGGYGNPNGGSGGTVDTTTGINRDITKAQEITKDTSVDPINVGFSLSWTNSVDENGNKTGGLNNPFTTKLTEWKSILAHPIEPFARSFDGINHDLTVIAADFNNVSVEQQNPIQVQELPGGPVWVSKWIDAHNDEVDSSGKPVPHPAPNLWPGNPFDENDEPSVGMNTDECRTNPFCKYTVSDKSPHLQALFYGVPGFKSFSQFHDSATTNVDGTEKSGAYKFFSIFPYVPANYYGAFGTMLRTRNQNQNSSQNSNNSNPVFSHDQKNE